MPHLTDNKAYISEIPTVGEGHKELATYRSLSQTAATFLQNVGVILSSVYTHNLKKRKRS